MKRGLTALVTFALIGGLAFMGFAGTAAAQEAAGAQDDDGLIDIGSDVNVDQDSTSAVSVETNQANSNEQTQIATSSSSSDKSYAKTTAVQDQEVTQVNSNEVGDVTSVSSNYADTDADTGISVDVDLGDL